MKNLKRVFRETCSIDSRRMSFTTHFSYELFKLQFHLLGHIVTDLRRFECLSSLHARPFQRSNMLKNSLFKMKARQLLKGLYETQGL